MIAPSHNHDPVTRRREPPSGWRYAAAVASVALATAARFLLTPVVGGEFPFITYFLAVTLAAWYGGLGPGVLSVVLSMLAAGYFFIPPANTLLIPSLPHLVGLFTFLIIAGGIVAVNDALRRTRVHAEVAAREAVERGEAAARAGAERERALASLRESEERLRLALTAGRMGVWDWDVATGQLSWSESLAPLHGLAPGDYPGTIEAFRALVHPDDRDLVQAEIERVLAGADLLDMEFRVVPHDGVTRWMAGHGRLFRDAAGQPVRMVGIGIDVTERRRSEETAARLAAIVESSQDAIISKTLDGIITSWNRGAERLYGYRADEMVGRSLSLLVPPELSNDLPQLLARIARGEAVEEYETGRVRRDGQRVVVSLAISPLKDQRGRIVGASAIARDITERKRLELELRERSEQVQTQAEELQAQFEELQLQNEELEAQDRHRNEFLAMLAHELRNPLAPIVASLELLRLRGPAEPTLERHRNVIERQARHLARLVDDLLDVSRVTQGKVALRRERVELGSVIEQALHVCSALVEERQHRLHVSMPRELVELDADPTRMVQIVCNLLTNAARYTDPGGDIWLSVGVEGGDGSLGIGDDRTSQSSLQSPISPLQSSHAVIRVRDSGRGIPADLLPRIFDLFYQGERTLARTEGGLGIGLTLVRSLVEQHGGTVEARSEGPGHGSEFIVRLPIADLGSRSADLPDTERLRRAFTERAAGDPSSQSEIGAPTNLGHPQSAIRNPQSQIRRVLLIEDNQETAEAQSEVLQLWGCEVRTVLTGMAALEAAAEFAPHVVLVDIGLPDLDGYEVARRLRADPTTRDALLIALTGYGEERVRHQAIAAGFDRHLTKPADPGELRRLVQKHP